MRQKLHLRVLTFDLVLMPNKGEIRNNCVYVFDFGFGSVHLHLQMFIHILHRLVDLQVRRNFYGDLCKFECSCYYGG